MGGPAGLARPSVTLGIEAVGVNPAGVIAGGCADCDQQLAARRNLHSVQTDRPGAATRQKGHRGIEPQGFPNKGCQGGIRAGPVAMGQPVLASSGDGRLQPLVIGKQAAQCQGNAAHHIAHGTRDQPGDQVGQVGAAIGALPGFQQAGHAAHDRLKSAQRPLWRGTAVSAGAA